MVNNKLAELWKPIARQKKEIPKEFYEWLDKNKLDLNDDFSRADMEWYAELAWMAAQEVKT